MPDHDHVAYRRTREQKNSDFLQARIWEEEVAGMWEPGMLDARFTSVNDLDLWLPGLFIELKEKKQKYTDRWLLLPEVPESEIFIMDELTVRRALAHYPGVLFLIRDVPSGRLKHVPLWELVVVERARVNRAGKGKWVIDMRHFRDVETPVAAHELAVRELVDQSWRGSGTAISWFGKGVPEV